MHKQPEKDSLGFNRFWPLPVSYTPYTLKQVALIFQHYPHDLQSVLDTFKSGEKKKTLYYILKYNAI